MFMNSLRNTVAAATIATGAILAGSAPEPAAAQGTSLAETLGLPLNKHRIHYNKATQSLVEVDCTSPSPEAASCKLHIRTNQTFLDQTEQVDIKKTPDGKLQVTAKNLGTNDWPRNIQMTDFMSKKDSAVASTWTANSPLAQTAQGADGKSFIIQNDVKEVKALGGNTVAMSSFVPLSETVGLKLSNVFDDATHTVQTSAIPSISFGGQSYTAGDVQPASRAMDNSSSDATILKDNLALAAKGGGTFAKQVMGGL